MKLGLKNVFGLLAVAASTVSFTRCATDAPEGAPAASLVGNGAQAATASTNTVVITNAPVATNSVAQNASVAGTNLVATISTNAPADTNLVAEIPPTIPTNLKLSKAVEEVVKLAQSGVGESVVLLYVDKAAGPFDLDADDIVYLNDIGISNAVIASMLNHDGASPELQSALTNKINTTASLPLPTSSNAPALPPSGPAIEYTSNYVATAPAPGAQVQYAAPGTVQYPGGPEAGAVQQPVIVQEPVVVQQPVVVEEEPVVVTDPAVSYGYFYSSLSPYGSWVLVSDYGWCWRPSVTVLHAGWRPYCHGGRWLYSDAGWYWHSDYSWGWAPFHYGRWYCSPRHGWVWTPGHTWAPSWVTWRRGPDYCGWAPLPPRSHVRPGVGFSYYGHDVGVNFSFGLSREHYTFVPARHFHNERVMDHVVPTEKTVNIYRETTVVNNYIVGNNNTVINRGISRDYVASHTKSEIRPVHIQEAAPAAGGRMIQPDRIQRRGNELVVYRPTTPPVSPSTTATGPSSGIAATGGRRAEEGRRPSDPALNRGMSVPTRGPISTSPGSRITAESQRTGNSPAVASLSQPVRPPEFAKPLPVRPEPQAAAGAFRPSRTALESAGRVPSGTVGGNQSAAISPRAESAASAVTPSRPIVGRSGAITPLPSGSSGSSVQPQIGRPASPVTPAAQPTARPLNQNSAVTPPVRNESAPVGNNATINRQSPSAHSPGVVVPRAVTPNESAPRSVPVTPPASISPSRSPLSQSSPFTGGRLEASAPQSTQPQPPAANVQTIQPNASSAQSLRPSLTPNTAVRSESISGRQMPAPQPVAPPTVLQPRNITPVPRFQSSPSIPQVSAPTTPAPSAPVRPAPSAGGPPPSSAPVRSAPAGGGGGGHVNAPAPAPAGRPNVIQSAPPTPGGRGRMEIGR